MKFLKDILRKEDIVKIVGAKDVPIESICIDSRKAAKNSLFIALAGATDDGHKFINQAIKNGAVAVVCENFPKKTRKKITYVKVKDSRVALAKLASNFYDNPSAKLKLVGVTGTNGKTTIATLSHRLFMNLGYKAGLISTIENKINETVLPTNNTTPDALTLNELFFKMLEEGCTHCFMEVSSHAVDQKRVDGLSFTGGIFTNLTHDHLDYHQNLENYFEAKKGFFDMLGEEAFALANRDDAGGEKITSGTKAKKYSYSSRQKADFKCKVMENKISGLRLDLDGHKIKTKLVGGFNAYNMTAVYSSAILLGEDKSKIAGAIGELEPAEGRFQHFKAGNNIIGIVDYAHTPDALENVLKTLQEVKTAGAKIITVVGCGGDRDAKKRPVMAKIAANLSDKAILTSDNPRSEEPKEIIKQMQKGLDAKNKKKTLAIFDRREAIKKACGLAKPGDIILVAGKGHEKYQVIKGVKHHFDDMEELKKCLK